LIVSAWRIVKRKYAKDAFSGEGSRKYGGRWNSPGGRIVYTAQSPSLAALEMLVHFDYSELLLKYVVFEVFIDSELINDLPDKLPLPYRSRLPSLELTDAGDRWYLQRRSLGLRVPSAVVPQESNILLNVMHPKFPSVKISKPQSFEFDSRLLRLGKA
jgi:RES domain-containing protein